MSTAIRIAHPIHVRRPHGEPRKARTHPEDDFRRRVEKQLTAHGWLWCHFPDSRRVEGTPGIPDDLAVRGDRILFIEYKAPGGKLRKHQIDWLFALLASGRVETCVWHPQDWPAIERAIA